MVKIILQALLAIWLINHFNKLRFVVASDAEDRCDAVVCAGPLSGHKCKVKSTSSLSFKRTFFNDCCAVWACSSSKRKVLLDGISSTETNVLPLARPTSLPEICDSTTCPNTISSTEDECHVDKEPREKSGSDKEGLLGCCPTLACKNGDIWSKKHAVAASTLPNNAVNSLQPSSKTDTCTDILCGSKPSDKPDEACKESKIEDTSGFKMIGNETECCPAWECNDGKNSQNIYETSHKNGWFYYELIKGDDLDISATCSSVRCPHVDTSDRTCLLGPRNFRSAAADFAGSHWGCCPVHICNRKSDSKVEVEVTYSIAGGASPKDDGSVPDCATALCGSIPEIPNYECEEVTDNTVFEKYSVFSVLGKWKSCCPLWRCSNINDSSVLQLRLSTSKFWFIAEITEQSILVPVQPIENQTVDPADGEQSNQSPSTSTEGSASSTVEPPQNEDASSTVKPSKKDSVQSTTRKPNEEKKKGWGLGNLFKNLFSPKRTSTSTTTEAPSKHGDEKDKDKDKGKEKKKWWEFWKSE